MGSSATPAATRSNDRPCRRYAAADGARARGLGDVDGDGTSDFLVTSGWSGATGYHAGRVLLFSSGIRKRAPELTHRV